MSRAGIGLRIALVAVIVAAVAVAIVAAGVVVVGGSSLTGALEQHGMAGADARAMFDHSVAETVAVALVVALLVGGALALVLGRRLGAGVRRTAAAADRMAHGDRNVRVAESGPPELATLATAFNRMARAVEDHERLRQDFVVNAAHELRTPLTNLQGYLEALRDGVIPPSPELFASLHEETDRLVRLAAALNLLAEDTDPAQVADEVSLAGAVASAVQLRRVAFEKAGIEVVAEVPDGVHVVAAPDQLAQILANLLDNAQRYTPRGGRVSISATVANGTATVRVVNTGVEIPASDLPHVFERFYRVEKSRERSRGGSGVGLAIVKHLVESAGGTVGADSPRGSTRVWFELPVPS